MRPRKFLGLLGGTAAGWPPAASAQQPEGLRRIGVLMNLTAADAESQERVANFLQALRNLGWVDGRNVRIDYRWAAAYPERFRALPRNYSAMSAWPQLVKGKGREGRS